MNERQKTILNYLQSHFPLEPRPFAAIADQYLSEDEIISYVKQLKQYLVIRRIGPIFSARQLGYTSTLIAAQVPPEKLDAFADEVSANPGVSHNYGRNHKFNIWFTLTVQSHKKIDETIDYLRKKYQLTDILNLPALKMFKLNTHFTPSGSRQLHHSQLQYSQDVSGTQSSLPALCPALSESQIAIIRQLQHDLPVVAEPFRMMADQINIDVSALLQQIKDWKSSGLIRRFGAIVRHQLIGFTTNAMIVFQVDPDEIDKKGSLPAAYSQVSHCYQRGSAPGWPYNLFAMTHCRDENELNDLAKEMAERIKPIKYDILFTTAEYKKESVKYLVESSYE
jgi:siroheme decarboxylase